LTRIIFGYVIVGQFRGWPAEAPSDVVDPDIEPPFVGEHVGDHSVDVRAHRHVRDDRPGARAAARGGRCEAVGTTGDEHDARAVSREPLRSGGADTRTRAGDHDHVRIHAGSVSARFQKWHSRCTTLTRKRVTAKGCAGMCKAGGASGSPPFTRCHELAAAT
jgi:hypothetical protein